MSLSPNPGFAVLGVLLLLLNMQDVVKTTLGQRGGPLTNWITSVVWRYATRFQERVGTHRMLSAAGIAAIVLIILIWLGLLWVSWWLILCGSRDAVLDPAGFPATFSERFEYCGYALVTLGTPSGFEPGTGWVRTVTPIAAGNGFAVLTLAIAYLTPLLSAATEKRQLALYVSTLGQSGEEILLHAWDGESCGSLEDHLAALTPMIALLAERHLTYPALHYFHATGRESAAGPSLAALDEALSLLEKGCRPEHRPDPFTTDAARRAISALLGTLRTAYVEPAEVVPPLPDLEALRRGGIPVADQDEFEAGMEQVEDRRRLLLALVKNDGWNWNDVHRRPGEDEEDELDEPMTEVAREDVLPTRKGPWA